MSHDHAGPRNNPQRCDHVPVHVPRGKNFNQGLGKPRPGWDSFPSGKMSLSFMDTHDSVLYSIMS